jgi:DnaJ-class molecular chaperone
MTVPKWSNTGTVLRLKGRGVPRANGAAGDEYVTLKIMLPKKRDPALEKLISQWASSKTGDQHRAMGA